MPFADADVPLGMCDYAPLPSQVTHALFCAGVVSTSTAVEVINSITGAVHLKQLSRHDMIRRVFTLLVGEVDSVEQDELLVLRDTAIR